MDTLTNGNQLNYKQAESRCKMYNLSQFHEENLEKFT
jgi:hypothetical protein